MQLVVGGSMKALEAHEMYFKMLAREDDLINSRLTWMLTFEGFLFAAVGFASNKNSIDHTELIGNLLRVIPIAGAAVSLAALFSVIRAQSSKRNLYKQYVSDWSEKHVEMKIPSPFGKSRFHGSEHGGILNILNPSILSPSSILFVWFYIILSSCFRTICRLASCS